MVKINSNYLKLKAGYLFPEIGRRVRQFSETHPQAKIVRLGIGDVSQPLPQAVVKAGQQGFEDMLNSKTFHGYGPEQGYDFLREEIARQDYKSRGAPIDADEIFISDGSKCDTGNFQELFSVDSVIAIPDPVYPVYLDTNVMAGRTDVIDASGRYGKIVYLDSCEDQGFLPEIPDFAVDVIYLCFPNNPTGVVATHAYLKEWVDYALRHQALILFDAAYEAFITDPSLPRSIYEIDGARECAVEFRSFSKTAGFTGTRCAFTVVPKSLMGQDENGTPVSLHALWNRRQSTKFNGVSYPVQKAALACYSQEGKAQIKEIISYYQRNARTISTELKRLGYEVFGGEHAPYIWLKTPKGMSSWEFFDHLLNQAHVVGTPGSGFGKCGEGFFRLSALGHYVDVQEALQRLARL